MASIFELLLVVLGLCAVATALHDLAQDSRQRWAVTAVAVVVVGGVWSSTTELASSVTLRAATCGLFGLLVVCHLLQRRGRSPGRSPSQAPAWWALLLWAWLFSVDAVTGSSDGITLVARLLPGLVLLGSALVAATGGVRLPSVNALATLSLGVLCVSVPFVDAWRPCDMYSCSVVGALLTGPFTSENALGMQAALAMAFALSSRQRTRTTLPALALGTLVLAGTASRTSVLAVAAVLVVVVHDALSTSRRPGRPRPPRSRGPLLAVLAVTALGIAVVLLSPPEAFSRRGAIWGRALDAVGADTLTGIGLGQWTALQGVGALSGRFTHSLYLYLIFSGGFVAVGLFVTFAVAVARGRRTAPTTLRSSAPLLVLMVTGLLESSWNPLALDATTWIAVALVMGALDRGGAPSGNGSGSDVRDGSREAGGTEPVAPSWAPSEPAGARS